MTDTILQKRDLVICTVSDQVFKETLRKLRCSPLLEDLIVWISLKDIQSLHECRNEKYMFQVLKQAAELKQSQLPNY